MPIRFCRALLFAIISSLILQLNYGLEVEAEYDNEEGEQYKPRRWSALGNGPYRLVVSAVELQPEESVALHVSSQQKKNIKSKPPEEKLSEEDITFELNEKYDKVTQRALSKRGRKRDRYVLEAENNRKRRRNQSVHQATTGLPHTMSYNLYNHFRPLEQDVPQDAIIPFLDFGRKLAKGVATTSGINSIEGSSTPRGDIIGSTEEIEDEENLFHEDMDVTVTKKAIERNAAPRGPVQPKQSLFTAYFKKSANESLSPENSATTPIGAIAKVQNDQPDAQNNTNTTNAHLDLQSNESGIKEHAILSPNYGLKLNKTEVLNTTETVHELNNATASMFIAVNITSAIVEEPTSTTTPANPNPTARILSTAVVTSVSVKESLRYPRIRFNYSSYAEQSSRNNSSLLKTDIPLINSNLTNLNETFPTVDKPLRLDLNYFNNSRRKHYTTLRPKTTTYRPVTFRSTFRRNGSYVPAVVHVMSTPPSYIEVPKIITHKPSYPFNRTLITQKVSSATAVTIKTTTEQGSVSSSTLPGVTVPINNTATVPINPESINSARIFPPEDELETSATTLKPFSSSTTLKAIKIASPSPSPILQTITSPDSDLDVNTTLETTTVSIQPTIIENTRVNSTIIHTTSPSSTVITMDSETLTPSSELPATQPITEHSSVTNQNPPIEHSTNNNYNQNKTIVEFKSLDEQSSEIITNNRSEFDEVLLSSSTATIITTTTIPTTKQHEERINSTKKPGLSWIYHQRNNSTKQVIKTHSVSDVDVAYQESQFGLATYVLAGLGIIPLLLGVLVLVRQLLLKSKKKVLDESEYSSEYNRSPLPTKLPRVPAHISWEENKPTPVPVIHPTKWEFPREKLRLQTVLGQGNFGQVWKAEADDICDHEGLTRLVAVKTVKEGASQREKEDLLRELAIMQELGAHPNVVTLLGCCTDKEPYLLIMEYVMYGKLLAFLREHRTRAHYFNFSDLSSALTSRDLTVFSYCVARGMEYLASKGIIHRDLAARNILVDHNKLCKIADFGMSRNVSDTGQIYEQRPNRGALPIRWMAPESLHFSLFTHKSDVWSFGILLWEIITLGSTPYNTMGAREVMRQVREGYRLEKPKHCKSEFYKIVTKCWHNDPTKRPTFTDLKQDIGALLGDKDTDGCYVDLEALAEEMTDQGH